MANKRNKIIKKMTKITTIIEVEACWSPFLRIFRGF